MLKHSGELFWAAAGLLLLSLSGQAQRSIPLTRGMVIDRSVTIRPGEYRISGSANLKTPAITIRGEGIVVDFNGATLIGSADDAEPDQFAGLAVLIDGGSRVTIRGATIRGFKVGILARNSPDLHITRNDLSHNWKQRLYSGVDKESLVDWMSYHQNEKDEWLRFGAAIYLAGCDRAEVDHNVVLQGQNGLMATASKHLKIWNNTFQFLSSIGVGLYRVTNSTIMHNRIDWCVRGYSHGFYNRGQDSAGLLMYEQSSHNTIAYNSVTHGGDGLFLWAGQSTMDTGKGGSNDNLFFRNDFSHAPTNGIEATFSRNRFIANRVEENWHGVWGGYSYDSVWHANRFARNSEAIAIEHGQNNEISANTFDGDETAIRLWQNAAQDPNWGYPKNRDTRSRDFMILGNTFRGNGTALSVRDTVNVKAMANTFTSVKTETSLAGHTAGFVIQASAVDSRPRPTSDIEPLDGGLDPMIKEGERRGRNTIIVDQWGPYDWRSPKLWPLLEASELRMKPYGGGPVRLKVLGPPGTWKVRAIRGATASPSGGKAGDVVTVSPTPGSVIDWEVALEYRGGRVVAPRGEVTAAGQPFVFRYSRFFVPVDWAVRFFDYDDTSDPVKHSAAFAKRLQGKSIGTLRTDRIDYLSGRNFEDGLPRDRFALVAEGVVDLPRGDYTIQVISDDGARVWMDGRLVLDAWDPHESRADRVNIAGGRRRLKVEYYEKAGWAEMRLDIQPRRIRQ